MRRARWPLGRGCLGLSATQAEEGKKVAGPSASLGLAQTKESGASAGWPAGLLCSRAEVREWAGGRRGRGAEWACAELGCRRGELANRPKRSGGLGWLGQIERGRVFLSLFSKVFNAIFQVGFETI